MALIGDDVYRGDPGRDAWDESDDLLKLSKAVGLMFSSPHVLHNHSMLLSSRAEYSLLSILIHLVWYQSSHPSQQMPGVFQVTSLKHVPQGCLGVLLGPGFG